MQTNKQKFEAGKKCFREKLTVDPKLQRREDTEEKIKKASI